MKKLIFILLLLSVTPAFAGKKAGVGAPAEPCYPTYNIGETYTQTDAATGMNLWVCKSNDSLSSWAQISGTGGTVSSVSGTVNQIDVATGSTTPVASLDPALVLPGSIQFGTTTTSIKNICGSSDVWIAHKDGTCTNYPAATSSDADAGTANLTAIAAMVNGDTLVNNCRKYAHSSYPSYPANLVNPSFVVTCPAGAPPIPGPSFTISNVVETSGNVVTLTTSNTLQTSGGQVVHISGLSTATWLNGRDFQVSSATGTTIVFTDTTGHGSASTADSGTAAVWATPGTALWTVASNGTDDPCLMNLTGMTNPHVRGLSLWVQETTTNDHGCPIGGTVGTKSTLFTGGDFRDIYTLGSSDGLFMVGDTAQGNFYNFHASSGWDTIKGAITHGTLNFYDSVLYSNGANTVCDQARNVNVGAQGGIFGDTHGDAVWNFFNPQMATNAGGCNGVHPAINAYTQGGIAVNFYGGKVLASGGTQPATAYVQSQGGHTGIFHITASTIYPVGTVYGSANDDGSSYFWDYQGVANTLTLYSTPSSSVNASISATTMYTTPNDAVNHTYQYRWAADLTVIGTSCVGNTTLGTSVIYQDPNAAAPQTVTAQAPITIALGGNGTLGGLAAQGTFTIVVKPNTAVQYSTTFSAGASCSPAPKYQIYPSLTFIN